MRELYIDFDGVILDTIPYLYKALDDSKINTTHRHENYNHDIGVIVMPKVETIVLCREATCRHRAHCVAQGIIPIHWTNGEQHGKNDSKH